MKPQITSSDNRTRVEDFACRELKKYIHQKDFDSQAPAHVELIVDRDNSFFPGLAVFFDGFILEWKS